jgi:hypothetical protein
MDFEIQAHALLPHLAFSAGYLGILLFARARRDWLALVLLVVFCVVLGLRDIQTMSRAADPILYAFILSYSSDVSSLIGGGIDYVLFSLLHPITGSIFDLRSCFMFLHLLYIPALYLLFRRLREYPGVFYLMAGWMIFVNSGLLLLANFFRQGLCVLIFLAMLVGISVAREGKSRHRLSIFSLPLLHASAIALLPNLLALGRRRYLLISSASFLAFCTAAHFAPYLLGSSSDYFSSDGADLMRVQLEIKIPTVYAMLLIGYLIGGRTAGAADGAARIQRSAVGLLLPTAGLLLLIDAPVIGLRFLYFSYAVAFLYVAMAVSLHKRETLFKLSALAICIFGFVTWTYPTVAVLLIW